MCLMLHECSGSELCEDDASTGGNSVSSESVVKVWAEAGVSLSHGFLGTAREPTGLTACEDYISLL